MELPLPQEPSESHASWLGAFAYPAFAVIWAASASALIGIAMYDTTSGWLMTSLDLSPLSCFAAAGGDDRADVPDHPPGRSDRRHL